VYNNFPWPTVDECQQERITSLAQDILDARKQYPDSTLSDLYNPLTMPPDLVKAHQKLDKEVDRLYRKSGFKSSEERIEHLFELYDKLNDKSEN
jgi:hypothetical protein